MSMEDLERQVSCELRAKGVCTKDAWLRQCLNHLRLNGPWSTVPSVLSEKVFQLFLAADLYLCRGPQPLLPDELANMHRQVVFKDSVVVLQVDEAVNISSSLLPEETDELSKFDAQESADKFRHAKLGRLNKLFVTDGHSQCVALDVDGVLQSCEYCPGMKIAVGAALVRRGALILRGGALRYLGGGVKRLASMAPRPNSQAQENSPGPPGEPLQRQPPQTLPPQTLPPQTLPPQTLPPQTLPPQTVATAITATTTITTARIEVPSVASSHESPMQVHLTASSTSSFTTSTATSPSPAAAAVAAATTSRNTVVTVVPENDYDHWQSPEAIREEPVCVDLLGSEECDLATRLEDAGALEAPCSDSVAEMITPHNFSSSGPSAPDRNLSDTTAVATLSTLQAVLEAARAGREYTVRGFASKLLRFRDQPGEPWDVCIAMDDGYSVQAVRIAPSVAHGFLAHLRVDDSNEGRLARMLAFQGFSGIFRVLYDAPDNFATPLSPPPSQQEPALEISKVVVWHGPAAGDRSAVVALAQSLLAIV